MRSVSVLGAAMVAACFAAIDLNETKSQGVHIGGRGMHLDIGNPHGYYGGSRGQYGYYGRYPSQAYHHNAYHHSHWGGGHLWHDTSHWDYHPGEYYRHYNHYHYMPGHYDFHREGHWDHTHH
jgi:hypothetical protein